MFRLIVIQDPAELQRVVVAASASGNQQRIKKKKIFGINKAVYNMYVKLPGPSQHLEDGVGSHVP